MTPEDFADEAATVYTLLAEYAEKEREIDSLELIPKLTQAQLLPVIAAAVAQYVDDVVQDLLSLLAPYIEERIAAGIAAHEARHRHSIHVG